MSTPNLNNQANVIITRAFLGSPIPSTETRNNVDLLTDRNDSTGLSIGVDGCIEFTPSKDCRLWVKTGVIYQKMYLYDQQGMSFRETQEVAQSVLTQGGSDWYELFPGFTFKANQPYSIYNYGPSIRYPNNGAIDVHEMFFEGVNSTSSPAPGGNTGSNSGSNNGGSSNSNNSNNSTGGSSTPGNNSGGTGNNSSIQIDNKLLSTLNNLTAISPYTQTGWVDNVTVIDAQKLNKIEAGIKNNNDKIKELIQAVNIIRGVLLSLK